MTNQALLRGSSRPGYFAANTLARCNEPVGFASIWTPPLGIRMRQYTLCKFKRLRTGEESPCADPQAFDGYVAEVAAHLPREVGPATFESGDSRLNTLRLAPLSGKARYDGEHVPAGVPGRNSCCMMRLHDQCHDDAPRFQWSCDVRFMKAIQGLSIFIVTKTGKSATLKLLIGHRYLTAQELHRRRE